MKAKGQMNAWTLGSSGNCRGYKLHVTFVRGKIDAQGYNVAYACSGGIGKNFGRVRNVVKMRVGVDDGHKMNVTGPSLMSVTSIMARNFPVATRQGPAFNLWTKNS